MAKVKSDDCSEVLKSFDKSEVAVLKAKKLTKKLLSYSKGQDFASEPLDIMNLIKQAEHQSLTDFQIDFIIKPFDEIPVIKGDAKQIVSVFSNILRNSAQSIPGKGRIELTVHNVFIDNNNIEELGVYGIVPGNYVKISISDNGPGIPESHIVRIFDPYFTTKNVGSGFGLPLSHSIVKNHGGTITADSVIGKGTIFNVYLPVSREIEESLLFTNRDVVYGTGKILFMDDDEGNLDVGTEILCLLGYHVDSVTKGEDAIEKFKKSIDDNKPYHAVILDLKINDGMNGKDTMRNLLMIDKNVKAIVASGYHEDVVVQNYRQYGFVEYIGKPYRIEEFSRILDEVIKKNTFTRESNSFNY